MNIMLAIDSNYILPAKVMLKSLSMNVSENLDVFLLYSKLNKNQIEDFIQFCKEKCNASLKPIYIDEQLFGSGMPISERFPVEAYYRLMAPFVLPSEIDRILWIDSDVIIKKDITKLYTSKLENVSLAVVRDQGSDIVIGECFQRLHLEVDSIYFNTGIILFNLDEIRRRWSKADYFNSIYGIKYKLEYFDQDILNVMFEKDNVIVPDNFNYQIKSWSQIKEADLREASIIHYVGPIKPWNNEYENIGKWIWWKYYCNCFGKSKYYMFVLKNRWILFYAKYLEKKVCFIKKLIKRVIS